MLVNPLFIHGWGFSSRIFESFRGIKPDLPFHGRGGREYRNIGTLVDELGGYLTDLHDIVGWSMGGSLAVLLTERFSERVNRIFLIGATPCFRRAWKDSNIRAFKLMIRKKGISAFRELAGLGDFEDDIELEGALKLLEDYVELDISDHLRALDKEVYVIHGREDRIVPFYEADRVHALLRRSKLIILNGGHLPLRDQETFIRTVFQIP